MINVLYSSLVVCFCLMFPQTKYEYDLLLLRQNDSLYFIYPFILHYYRMFSIPFQCPLYLLYTSRGVFIWRINYCHCHALRLMLPSTGGIIYCDEVRTTNLLCVRNSNYVVCRPGGVANNVPRDACGLPDNFRRLTGTYRKLYVSLIVVI